MSWDTFNLVMRRLREIRWAGPVEVIRYNEPLLVPHLVDLITSMKQWLPRCRPMVTTNGDRLTLDLARRLIAAGVTQFNVTRHPPCNEQWDAHIRELRHALPRHIRFLNSPGDEGWTNQGGLVTPPGPNALAIAQRCYMLEAMVADINGCVVFCANDYYKDRIVGDLRTQSIHEIYYSPELVRWRRELRRGIARLDICRRCMDRNPTVPRARSVAHEPELAFGQSDYEDLKPTSPIHA